MFTLPGKTSVLSGRAFVLAVTAFTLLALPRGFAQFADTPPERAEIREALQPFIDSHELAGVIAVVATPEGIVSQTVLGFADIEAGRTMDRDTQFWIASMTKGYTGAAVMALVDEGKLLLDDPVTKYIPELSAWQVVSEKTGQQTVLVPPARPVTVRDLMCHTSGLAFLSELQHRFGLVEVPLEFAAAASVTGPLQFQPGENYLYSNQGINIAGRIVEIVSGKPFDVFMQERFFDPLEMKETTFWPSEDQVKRLAKSYKSNAAKDGMVEAPMGFFKRPLTDRTRRFAEPGGGLFSTTGDVVRFCQMLAAKGQWNGWRYLSEEAVRELGKDQTGKLKRNYGLGWTSGPGFMAHGGARGTHMGVTNQGGVCVFMIQGEGPAVGKAQAAFHIAALKVLASP